MTRLASTIRWDIQLQLRNGFYYAAAFVAMDAVDDDLVEDPHVALDLEPLVVEALDAVEHVGSFTDGVIDVAVGEELLDVDRQHPARVGGHRHLAPVHLEGVELRLRIGA